MKEKKTTHFEIESEDQKKINNHGTKEKMTKRKFPH